VSIGPGRSVLVDCPGRISGSFFLFSADRPPSPFLVPLFFQISFTLLDGLAATERLGDGVLSCVRPFLRKRFFAFWRRPLFATDRLESNLRTLSAFSPSRPSSSFFLSSAMRFLPDPASTSPDGSIDIVAYMAPGYPSDIFFEEPSLIVEERCLSMLQTACQRCFFPNPPSPPCSPPLLHRPFSPTPFCRRCCRRLRVRKTGWLPLFLLFLLLRHPSLAAFLSPACMHVLSFRSIVPSF